jgi:hypothetical protein
MKKIESVVGGCYEHNVTQFDYKSRWDRVTNDRDTGICVCCFSPCVMSNRMLCKFCK